MNDSGTAPVIRMASIKQWLKGRIWNKACFNFVAV